MFAFLFFVAFVPAVAGCELGVSARAAQGVADAAAKEMSANATRSVLMG